MFRCVSRRSRDSESDCYGASSSGSTSSDGKGRELDLLRRQADHKQRHAWYHKITHRDSVVSHLPQFPRGNIHFGRKLEEGRYGDVYIATAESIFTGECTSQVTVKTLRNDSSKEDRCDFLSEAWFRNGLKHHNIVRLLGSCTNHSPKLMILELFEESSNLVAFVQHKDPNETGSVWPEIEVLNIALDIANGVEYLQKKNIVYKDLCAASCVVMPMKLTHLQDPFADKAELLSPSRSYVVKLAEFGLTCDLSRREYYFRQNKGELLTRWMSPEAILDGVFTEQTQVWTYGVVLWEVASFGQLPYSDQNPSELLDFLASGQRLPRPLHCSKKMYQIMSSCWQLPSSSRPSIPGLIETLRHMQQRSVSSSSLFGSHKKLKSLFSLPLSISSGLNEDHPSGGRFPAPRSAPASPMLRCNDHSPFQRGKNLSQRSTRSLAGLVRDRTSTPIFLHRRDNYMTGESWQEVAVNRLGRPASAASKHESTSLLDHLATTSGPPSRRASRAFASHSPVNDPRRYSCPLELLGNNNSRTSPIQAVLVKTSAITGSMPLLSAIPKASTPASKTRALVFKSLKETSL